MAALTATAIARSLPANPVPVQNTGHASFVARSLETPGLRPSGPVRSRARSTPLSWMHRSSVRLRTGRSRPRRDRPKSRRPILQPERPLANNRNRAHVCRLFPKPAISSSPRRSATEAATCQHPLDCWHGAAPGFRSSRPRHRLCPCRKRLRRWTKWRQIADCRWLPWDRSLRTVFRAASIMQATCSESWRTVTDKN